MKKIISLIAAASVLLMGLVSCNIETSRSFQGDLTIEVRNLPDSVKALAFWGTPNEWKAANIEEKSDIYIADVESGTATFKLGTTVYSAPLWCQFQPLQSRDEKLNDATWWQTSFSGSSAYADAENNIVYDFTVAGAVNLEGTTTLVLDVKDIYSGVASGVFKKRFNTPDYQAALKLKK